MIASNWLRSGRPPSEAPARRPRHGLGAGLLVALAVVGVSQTGCQSDPCRPRCGGGCGRMASMTSWWSNTSSRLFHRNQGCSTCGMGEAPVAEFGAPVVGPAPVAVPGPTVITPGPSSTVPSTTVPGPSTLEPAPSAAPGPDTGARNGTGKAAYEAYRSNYRPARSRSDVIARGEIPALEPAPGPRSPAATSNPLANLPPVDIPSVDESAEGRTSQSPPPAPAAVREKAPRATVAPAATETRTEAAPAASAPSPESPAPGINRFAVVDSKLAGGSFPTPAGLDWLADKGYKTFLDLRDPGTAQPASIQLVTTRGLRYVALPITDKTLDSDHISRFNLELALADARPLYFCDADGRLAGALWYIRRLTQDKIDPEVAAREAEQLGMTDAATRQAAARYLDGLKKDERAAAGAPPAAVPAVELAAVAVQSPAPPPLPSVPNTVPAAPEPESSGGDSTAWGSAAALVVTGLGVPLAYWSASSLPTLRGWTRASLPGPGRRPKLLPPASGA